MIIKCKVKDKLEEIELDETDVIKAVKEEYEKTLTEKEKKIKEVEENAKKEKEQLRQEHVKQMRAIILGRKEEINKPNLLDEIDEEDEEEKIIKKAKEIYKTL